MDKEEVPGPNVAARLHVMLARDAPFAVVLRRGPSKQVCSIGWNLGDDSFKVGQWLKGRIDELSCDLSPDGRHLLYSADKYRIADGGRLAYTVLSRAPYLKALKIWKHTPFYGGAFLNNTHFALLGNTPQPTICRVSPAGQVKNALELAQIEPASADANWKRQRDGWSWSREPYTDRLHEWQKKSFSWKLGLEIRSHSFHPNGSTYTLCDLKSGEDFDCARWQWADFREKRVLWAQEGKIFAAKIWDGGRGPLKQLADFNDWTFQPIAAPY